MDCGHAVLRKMVQLTAAHLRQQRSKIPQKKEARQRKIPVTVLEEQEIGENGFPVNIPQFTTKDMDGNKVTNDIFAEYDLTVVNFWATYCNPCIDELPELAEWKKELPDNVNLIGLLVDVDEKGSEQYKLAEKIISQTGADYQHLIATEEFDDIISNLVGVPTTFFVDSTGKIIGEPFAGADVSAYKQTVEDYLNGK